MSTNSEIFTDAESANHVHSEVLAKMMAEWFARDNQGVPVAIDFGCGDGWYLEYLYKHNFSLIGLEGNRKMTIGKPGRIQWDLRDPIWLGGIGSVICLEVMEHIAEEYHDVVMDNISRHCSGKLVMSWAVPGQGGLRHVSERAEPFVHEFVARWGFKALPTATSLWRELAGIELSWFKNSLYLFERPETP